MNVGVKDITRPLSFMTYNYTMAKRKQTNNTTLGKHTCFKGILAF